MLYAILNDKKVEPTPGQRAKCPLCEKDVISKCGELNIWHWAHTTSEHCDDWYEPETKWHRDWKKIFGQDSSEVIITKENKKHIADIFTYSNIVIELQNSPISTATIRAREQFYGEKMIWIVNAYPFLLNFKISSKDPNYAVTLPSNLSYSEELLSKPGWFLDFEDIVIDLHLAEFLNVRYAFNYNPEINKWFKSGTPHFKFGKYFIQRIKKFNEVNRIHQIDPKLKYFIWSHPKKSWTVADRHVFIDFDKENLFYVNEGMGMRYGNGKIIPKKTFISKYKTA